MLRSANFVLVLLISSSLYLLGQGPCPTATVSPNATLSGNSICVVPQVYGAGGLVGSNDGGPLGPTNTGSFKHVVHFQTSSLASFSPLTSEIGTQLSQLPITSPASGFIFSFNPSVGVVSQTIQNFGPILSERAQTIGKHKMFVGFSYQYFDFDKVDGVNLRNFSAVFQHEAAACLPDNPTLTCLSDGQVKPTKDFIDTQNRIDLKVHQFTAVGTFGITDRLDVSIAIPILNVRMDMTSNAVIKSFETANDNPPCCVHQFDPTHKTPGEILFPADPVFGNNHASFFRANSASGIGDLIFRGKFQAVRGEKAGLAVGLDVHVPTGDERNFLGSGTWGARPFATFSYAGRISPHASVGYQVNGDSILAGNIAMGTKDHLPNDITYSAGVDAGINRRLSVSADFLGQALQDARKISSTTFTDYFHDPGISDIMTSRATINQLSIAAGAKVNPIGKLLLTANVLFRVNDSGLHSKPVPLIGVSYTF